jgi:hypothetical protein
MKMPVPDTAMGMESNIKHLFKLYLVCMKLYGIQICLTS